MPESTTLLELLLGSRTRVRILTHLLSVEQGMTRHALAKEIGGGVGPVYEQVDRFIALGVLEERDNGNIFIDRSFPFMDTLTDLVLAGVDYFDPVAVPVNANRCIGSFVSAMHDGITNDLLERCKWIIRVAAFGVSGFYIHRLHNV